ncbi:3-phosphoshikimate 1-carboxyvinyltransferase [Alkalicaulis satelles]|uniref:3-phosphoshikimate 1-carboxyvinyltransferase n=1 Tax=Alkalicaulis satelles TaxID=2609175 RepID=A0A5M6ZIH4_9PROT|nr:3-phosphoshikimate 1-carboxyvinyltransferase [Alkalicaulis satelles]KAA5804130.1 3-phosphoshikimate 1-carboxyvinyltransferase [Alkalicaulis satelles]
MIPANPSVSGPRTASPVKRLAGRLPAPADKSVSHRALMFSALADGTSRISNLLESADVTATARAVAALGADVRRDGPGAWTVTGRGAWTSPAGPLDLGNAGTGVRLLMGAAARFDLEAVFTGDESLSARPMARVLDPLALMGVKSRSRDGRLPVRLTGSRALRAIDYAPPVASAQVKSAILMAGLGADGETTVREAHATRGHTETMAPLYGADMSARADGAGLVARVRGGRVLTPHDLAVPGDPSSAAFAIAAALITPDSDVTLTGVMDNPARNGLYAVLRDMGADLTLTPAGTRAGETLVDISARSGMLTGIEVAADRAPSMIDEYPILSVIAAFAEGATVMKGLAELRAKESDRLAASAAMLAANGVRIELGEDYLVVHGCGAGGVPGGGRVETRHDHRLAMSGLVMGLGAREPVSVDDAAMIATSYPGFFDDMAALGADIA